MMSSTEVISMYETVSDLSSQMLAAARSGNWDHLAELESHCAQRIQALKQDEAMTELAGEVRSRKVQIIHQILAHDRAIRDLTTPWMARLSALMQSTGTERKLAAAYGVGLSA
jgi:flagellar protein FliT